VRWRSKVVYDSTQDPKQQTQCYEREYSSLVHSSASPLTMVASMDQGYGIFMADSGVIRDVTATLREE